MAWDDKPKKVHNSPEKLQHIARELSKFKGRRYFPVEEEAFDATVEAVAEIVYDKPNGHLWDKKGEDGKPAFNEYAGWVDNDLEWLVKRTFRQFSFCPSPAHFRAVYCQNFKPADGIHISIDPEDL